MRSRTPTCGPKRRTGHPMGCRSGPCSTVAKANGPTTASSASSRVISCAKQLLQLRGVGVAEAVLGGDRSRRAREGRRARSRGGQDLLGQFVRLELVECLLAGEGEEHALQRADHQLEAADDRPGRRRGRARRHPACRVAAATTRPPRGERCGAHAGLTDGDLERARRRRWWPARTRRPAPARRSSAAVPSHTTRPRPQHRVGGRRPSPALRSDGSRAGPPRPGRPAPGPARRPLGCRPGRARWSARRAAAVAASAAARRRDRGAGASRSSSRRPGPPPRPPRPTRVERIIDIRRGAGLPSSLASSSRFARPVR